MLVDDQADVLFTYLSFLEGQGFNVESFTDPIVALRQFAQEDTSKYDLVVMDISFVCHNLMAYSFTRGLEQSIRPSGSFL